MDTVIITFLNFIVCFLICVNYSCGHVINIGIIKAFFMCNKQWVTNYHAYCCKAFQRLRTGFDIKQQLPPVYGSEHVVYTQYKYINTNNHYSCTNKTIKCTEVFLHIFTPVKLKQNSWVQINIHVC